MRLVYFGTPSIAVPPLLKLVDEARAPVLVVTRRDRPKGRGLLSGPSPVRVAAESRGLPVATPARADAPEEIERLKAARPDLIVLVAYGQILGPELLAVPHIGAINLHFSLLPRHRGASPVQAAILAGDPMTGVTTMWMTAALDEGPIFQSVPTPIGPDEDAGSLAERLARIGAQCLADTVAKIERGEIARVKQDSSHASYARKLTPEDARLTLADDPVRFVRKVRAFAPEPGANLTLESGRLLVLAASPGGVSGTSGAGTSGAGTSGATPGVVRALDPDRGLEIGLDQGSVWLRTVRPSGRRTMSGMAYANGARLKPGDRLAVRA